MYQYVNWVAATSPNLLLCHKYVGHVDPGPLQILVKFHAILHIHPYSFCCVFNSFMLILLAIISHLSRVIMMFNCMVCCNRKEIV